MSGAHLYDSIARHIKYTIDFSKNRWAAIIPQKVEAKCNIEGEKPVVCVELLSSSFLSFSSSEKQESLQELCHTASHFGFLELFFQVKHDCRCNE